MAKVLIDNGLALNILLMITLDQFPVDKSFIRLNHMMVRVFDGAKSELVEGIDIKLQIGPHVFNVPFQIINTKSAYILLLGRPWIHSASAISSSLY